MGDSGKLALVIIAVLAVAFFLLCYKPTEPPVIEPADSSFNGAFSVTPSNFSIYKSQTTVNLQYVFNLVNTNFTYPYTLGQHCRFKIEDSNGILSKAYIRDWDVQYMNEGGDCLNKFPTVVPPNNVPLTSWCVYSARYGAPQKLRIETTNLAEQGQTYRIYLVAQCGLVAPYESSRTQNEINTYNLFKEVYPYEHVKEILNSNTWLIPDYPNTYRYVDYEFYEVRYPIGITIL